MRLNAVLLTLLTLPVATTVVANDLQRCRAVPEAMARLACYDALAALPAVATATSPAAPPAAKPDAVAQFGLESQTVRNELEGVDSQIIGLFEGWGPRTMFRLANGQIWQVVDDSSAVYDLQSPKVRVRRAAMGSFLLDITGANRTPRVRRVN